MKTPLDRRRMLTGGSALALGVLVPTTSLGMIAISLLQAALLHAIHDPKAAAFQELAATLHDVVFFCMPQLALLHAALAWQGWRLAKGPAASGRPLAGVAIAVLGDLFVYGWELWTRVAPKWEAMFALAPAGVLPVAPRAWTTFTVVSSGVIACAVYGTLAGFAWKTGAKPASHEAERD